MFWKVVLKSILPAVAPILTGIIALVGVFTSKDVGGGPGGEMGGGLTGILFLFVGIVWGLVAFVLSTIILYVTKCSPVAIKWIYWIDFSICAIIALFFLAIIVTNIFS